jgi:hypothetical protein
MRVGIPLDRHLDFIPITGYADAIIVAVALRSVIRHSGPETVNRHRPEPRRPGRGPAPSRRRQLTPRPGATGCSGTETYAKRLPRADRPARQDSRSFPNVRSRSTAPSAANCI